MKQRSPKATCHEVREIGKPIMDLFEINFFSHTRAYHDGYFSALMTSTELTEYYLAQKYPIRFSKGKGLILENGFYIEAHLEDDSSSKVIDILQDKFNTAHFVFIVEKNKEYDDMYSLATHPANYKIINKYLNNVDILKHFLLYYKDKSAALIKNAEKVKYESEFFSSSFQGCDNSLDIDNRFESMPIEKITLMGNLGEVMISKRELDCLKLLVKGFSFKEIGKNLNISPRTVETYVNNLKNKLGYDKKIQLMELAYSKEMAQIIVS